LQNVWKNSLIVNVLLETLTQFDIIFIQEPPWSEICKIPSALNNEGEDLMERYTIPIGYFSPETWIIGQTLLESLLLSISTFFL